MHTQYQHGGDIYSNKVSMDYSANINPLGLPQGVKEELARCIKSRCAASIRTAGVGIW